MILFADLSTGASGDKLMGGLLEVAEQTGVYDLQRLSDDLTALVDGLIVERTKVRSASVMSTHIEFRAEADQHHRHWGDIRELIEGAAIGDGARKRALDAFALVAAAESEVHGVDIEEVHFHEVGAFDSIADIVGVSILLDALAPSAFHATPMALGSGTVECAHGLLPVPAPATARIVADSHTPSTSGAFACELTTPTGAALIAANATSFEPMPPCTPIALGYGCGSRNLEGTPNIVSIIAARTPVSDLRLEQVMLLETNLDHITPEQAAFATRTLISEGALDVWEEAYGGKKGRLGIELSVLCEPRRADEFTKRVHHLTGSLGVRRRIVSRSVLVREHIELDTPYGKVRYKAAGIDDESFIRPEHDDVAALAAANPERSYGELYQELSELGAAALPTLQRPSDS